MAAQRGAPEDNGSKGAQLRQLLFAAEQLDKAEDHAGAQVIHGLRCAA